ncbi:unnamed protein product, partial [Heterosigma akashiwo]
DEGEEARAAADAEKEPREEKEEDDLKEEDEADGEEVFVTPITAEDRTPAGGKQPRSTT